VLFEKKYVSLKYDIFNCFNKNLNPTIEPEGNLEDEAKTYCPSEDRNGGQMFDMSESRPIRKPDPDLRTLRRQISFGSTTGFGSIKRKPTNLDHDLALLSPPPGNIIRHKLLKSRVNVILEENYFM